MKAEQAQKNTIMCTLVHLEEEAMEAQLEKFHLKNAQIVKQNNNFVTHSEKVYYIYIQK